MYRTMFEGVTTLPSVTKYFSAESVESDTRNLKTFCRCELEISQIKEFELE